MGRHASLLELGRRLQARGLIVGREGNLSCRLPGGQILITPAGKPKTDLVDEDLALLAPDGSVLRGRPSSERALHAELYRRCPQARYALHAHPPVATAWSLAHPDAEEIPVIHIAEALSAFGKIPIAAYARPGSADLAASVAPLLPRHRAVILSGHGAFSWGESAEEALSLMEQLEQLARILRDAFILGSPKPLSERERREILEKRER